MSLPRDFKMGEKIIVQHRENDAHPWSDYSEHDSVQDARTAIEASEDCGEFRMMKRSPAIKIEAVVRRSAAVMVDRGEDPDQTTLGDHINGRESGPPAITISSASA